MSALDVAVLHGSEEAVRVLLSRGCTVSPGVPATASTLAVQTLLARHEEMQRCSTRSLRQTCVSLLGSRPAVDTARLPPWVAEEVASIRPTKRLRTK